MSAASESGLPAVLADRRRRSFVVLLAIAAAMAAVVVASAGLTQRVFDALVQGRQAIGAIGVEGLGLVALAAAGAVLRLVERVETERLGQDYVHELRQTVFDHLSRVSPRALQARGRGGIALRFTGDLSAMRQWVSLGLARLVVATVTLLLAALGLALLSPWLGLLVGSVLGVGAAVTGYLGRSIQGAVADARRARTRLANNVFEKVGAMGVVQAHGGAARERRRHGRQSRKLAGLMLRRAFAVGRLRAAVFGAAGTATAGSLVLGGWLVARGAMTPGGVVGAMVLVGLITPSMHDLGRVTEFWRGARVAREKLAALLAVRATVKNAAAVRRSGRIEGRIEFDGVVVRGALDGVSAVVEPGQTVALAGPSGAGKSTLLAAAARLVDVQAGTVRLDGIGIRKLSLGTLHRAVGIMSPDLPLLRGTLEDNLRYRLPDAPLAEFERVCRLCRVDELIATLADGLSTRIREGGGNLSLGQRRRVQLARAILGTPPILLLDEPTANLDLESKEAILDVVASYPGTVVVATHDRALCAAADAVWHLDDGRLIAEAPPASPP
ncbi:MAG: ABC transporter ATP-binding protein, partial [Planctomycetes bacterium]|nr:ABC transporter ATP-binding protein [Planctomycetota bacterium]